MPAALTASFVPTRSVFYHRGFALEIRPEASGARFAFKIVHEDLVLHTSRAEFGTPQSADRAARRFVDDALGAFEYATQALAA